MPDKTPRRSRLEHLVEFCPADRGWEGVSPDSERCRVCGYVADIWGTHDHRLFEVSIQQAGKGRMALSEQVRRMEWTIVDHNLITARLLFLLREGQGGDQAAMEEAIRLLETGELPEDLRDPSDA